MDTNISKVISQNGVSRRKFLANTAGIAAVASLPVPILCAETNHVGLSTANPDDQSI
jgi:hypothetical protein